jgi:molecular chaperone GrpE
MINRLKKIIGLNNDSKMTNEHNEALPLEDLNDLLQDESVDNQEVESENETAETVSKQDYNELKDKYLRMFAEFDNYKKRTVKERIDTLKTASQDTLSAFLPIVDDFDRAAKNGEGLNEGIQLIYNKINGIMSQRGIKAMDSTGEAFNAEFHEAITEIPVPDEAMKGKVIDTVEKGYFLNDKIIRYAKVVVGK